jgi:hypothetical protein
VGRGRGPGQEATAHACEPIIRNVRVFGAMVRESSTPASGRVSAPASSPRPCSHRQRSKVAPRRLGAAMSRCDPCARRALSMEGAMT